MCCVSCVMAIVLQLSSDAHSALPVDKQHELVVPICWKVLGSCFGLSEREAKLFGLCSDPYHRQFDAAPVRCS